MNENKSNNSTGSGEGKTVAVFARQATGLTRSLSTRDALIGNVMSMGISFVFVYEFFASALYPGVNLPETVLVALLPGIVIALVYYLFTVAMPRTGGDYVWIGRIVHPAVGFVGNFYITLTLLTVVGTVAAWIPVYGFGPMLAGIGLLTSNASLVNFSTSISTPPLSFVIAIVSVIIFVVPLFFSPKSAYKLLTVMFAITAVGTLVLVGAYFSASPSTFQSNFNSLSTMNYVQTVQHVGLSGFSASMTFTGAIFTILNFVGFNFSSYYTGEVRNVRKSQIYAMIGSLFMFALFMGLVYLSAYHSAGSDFLGAVSSLASTGSTSYTLPAPPVLNFLVAFAVPSPWVVLLSGLGLLAACFAQITVLSFIVGRNIFAWSFDRLMPSWLVRLDSRRGSPYLIVALTMLLGIIFAGLYIYTVFFSYLLYAVINVFVTFGLASLAAIVFPYRRKDVFSSSPDIVKKKIGPVPVIAILGAVGLVLSIFLSYATLLPAVTPPATSPVIQALAYLFVPLTGIAALIIYFAIYYYRKHQGLNMMLVFSEIPPE